MAIEEQNMEVHQAIINIKKAETRREIFAKLKRLKNKQASHGINNILIEDEDGAQVSITDPDDMNKTIIAHNREHFSQADGAPFTIEPLKSLLGSCATNGYAHMIIDGTLDIEQLGLSEATEAIIQQLGKRISDKMMDINISTDEVIKGYQKWSEYTLTSPPDAI